MIFRLVKIALVLLFGALIGLLLGFAYSAHLFGPDLVSREIAHMIGGDSVLDVPPPSSTASLEGVQYATAVLIPKLGACIGFGIAASVLLGAISIQVMKQLIANANPNVKPVSGSDGKVRYVAGSPPLEASLDLKDPNDEGAS